jgi:tetratricopeptide (TPR) repeat protein
MGCLAAAATAVADEVPSTPDESAAVPTAIEIELENRLQKSGRDPSLWRLLGRARLERNDWEGALEALNNAVTLDPLSAAAQFDFGRAAAKLGKKDVAAAAWKNVTKLAPDSDYARDVVALMEELESDNEVQLAGYEIRSFDGSNLTPLVLPREKEGDPDWREALDVRFDIGAQYNSNVSLAPSSREFVTGRRASAQGTASFSANWSAFNANGFRAGPSIDTDFTLNENNLDNFNLQSYRPGVFADAIWDAGDFTLRPRIAYSFDHDEFDGDTFGNKHAVAFSSGAYWTPNQISTLYYSIDHNNIADDGANPNVTSQDGWSNTIGVLHDFVDREWFWRSFRIGTDFQNVNTDGANFRYLAWSLYSQSIIVVVPTVHLKLRSGYAYRDYPDFTETPSRNTHIIRTGAELRKYFDYGISAAIYTQYDRFASRNDQFDRSRFLSGAVMTWEY